MWQRLRRLFSRSGRDAAIREQLDRVRSRLPTPVLWLFGRTQSGKTSIIKYLTGADRAEIGNGFRPCTRFSQRFAFPTDEAPLVTFLDTRGLDEPGYDATEDLARFNEEAHAVLVTIKLLDHAQEHVLQSLRTLRRAQPHRPVILVVTCLHEAYPQQQHPQPYPFSADGMTHSAVSDDLARSLAEQRRRFDGLVDRIVPVDLTPADEGFAEPNYGGDRLREVLLDVLPAALGQTLVQLDRMTREFQDAAARRALPHILGYSTLAATAGALPIPFVDLLLLSAIQSRMVFDLAELYGQPLSGERFGEIAGTLGLGILARQAGREAVKLIPGIGTLLGSVAGGALAGASTYALGKAFCFYYRAVHQGHVPRPDELRRYYQQQLAEAEQAWKRRLQAAPPAPTPAETGS